MADPPETAAGEIPEDAPPTPVEGNGEQIPEATEETLAGAADDGYDDVSNKTDSQESDGKEARAAPQAAQHAAPTRLSSSGSQGDGELVDCKLSPLDMQNQRQNLKAAFMDNAMDNATSAAPPLVEESNGNGEHHRDVSFNEGQNRNDNPSPLMHQSALHQDEYSQYNDRQRYDPHNHESALAGVVPSSGNENYNERSSFAAAARKKKSRLAGGGAAPGGGRSHGAGGGGGGRHSHPRKSPYRSEVARLRHAQRLEREQRRHSKDPPSPDDASNSSTTASGKSITLKDTTAPPDTAFFSIQSSKFKHSLLHSLGEFLTSAFADDEESSGSYFSQDLLDQLSDSNPHLKGVWLQAKNLNDDHVKQLCEALIRNKVATEVWLPSNQITDTGAAHIAHMLKFNKSIKELFLGENDIGPKGAAALASALARGNTTLVALGLGDNRIGVEGAGAFAAALRHNHSLHTLDVKNNGIPKKSSIRGLLNKMLEFNASDPGDESLVLGLQEELTNLVSSLPPDVAESVVLQAEEALKMAMLCRKRGDKIGAAEAEGIFIRICTTGEPPVDPPEEMAQNVSQAEAAAARRQQQQQQQESKKKGGGGGRPKKQLEPDRVDELESELSTLKFNEGEGGGSDGGDKGRGKDEPPEGESTSIGEEHQPREEGKTMQDAGNDADGEPVSAVDN